MGQRPRPDGQRLAGALFRPGKALPGFVVAQNGQAALLAGRGGNVFEELLETVKVASLGQISEALFDVGGRYRRSM